MTGIVITLGIPLLILRSNSDYRINNRLRWSLSKAITTPTEYRAIFLRLDPLFCNLSFTLFHRFC
jgi:hypothetical protein